MFSFNFEEGDGTVTSVGNFKSKRPKGGSSGPNSGLHSVESPPKKLQALDSEILLNIPVPEEHHLDDIEIDGVKLFQALNEKLVEISLKEGGEKVVSKLVQLNIDVQSGIYEGGFKIWECTYDLLRWLKRSSLDWKNSNVLELGCGAGYPGLFALTNGAICVHFQDYVSNACVLEQWTVPNVLSNTPRSELERCRFIYGDWASEEIEGLRNDYNLILMSETVYNTDSLPALAQLIDRSISPGGHVILSAKSYYYGVGGSVDAFTQALQSVHSPYKWKSEEVWATAEGLRRVVMLYTAQVT
eukprot:gene1151-4370_t